MENVRITPRTIAVVRIIPPNHKTGHSSLPTMQTGRITPLDPIRGGFGLRGVRVAVQSAIYLFKKYETHFSYSYFTFFLSLLSLSLFLSLSSLTLSHAHSGRRGWRAVAAAARRGGGSSGSSRCSSKARRRRWRRRRAAAGCG